MKEIVVSALQGALGVRRPIITNFFIFIFFFFIGDGLRGKERLELLVVYNCQKDCKRIKSLHIVIYHINCGVMQGFPALRKAVTTQVKRYRICSRVLI